MTAIPELISGPAAVIGDIHGSADALEALLSKLGGRKIFVLGDLCDRGPDTKRVLDLLIACGAEGVLGNHEEWFKAWAEDGTLEDFVYQGAMGSRPTFTSYGVGGALDQVKAGHRNVPRAHVDFLKSLHHVAGLTVEGEKFWLVHAGVNSMHVYELGKKPNLASVVPGIYARRSRSAHWNSSAPEDCAELDRPVLMGHICVDEPRFYYHVVALDTGAGTLPTGKLSALLLPEREVISVPAPGQRMP